MTSMPMAVGCCVSTDLSRLEVLKAARVDFCELPVASLLMGDQQPFSGVVEAVGASGVPARAANVLLPGDLRIVGPIVDQDRIDRYLGTAIDRMATLGIETVVLGSGASRAVPEGFAREEALTQMESFVRSAVEVAAGRGLTIALENLRTEETNLLNTVAEAAAFIRERDLTGARLIADVYHMEENGEDVDLASRHADLVAHVHLADTRRLPPGQGNRDLARFVRGLRESGYAGRWSIECRWFDFTNEAPAAIEHVRRLLAAA